jgi:hypothetical protein
MLRSVSCCLLVGALAGCNSLGQIKPNETMANAKSQPAEVYESATSVDDGLECLQDLTLGNYFSIATYPQSGKVVVIGGSAYLFKRWEETGVNHVATLEPKGVGSIVSIRSVDKASYPPDFNEFRARVLKCVPPLATAAK